jgi:hypothetical protein
MQMKDEPNNLSMTSPRFVSEGTPDQYEEPLKSLELVPHPNRAEIACQVTNPGKPIPWINFPVLAMDGQKSAFCRDASVVCVC